MTKAAPPIEVQASPKRPLGMSASAFLERYWQKHPLLIRGASAGFTCPITPDDLAGLACEELALSRSIHFDRSTDRWSVRSGPFDEADFAAQPSSDWTLLVQDVDKWDADVRELLATFSFIPRWRVDDIMVSYAVPGGSVGAHVDQYDVFLLQGLGHRRWSIDARHSAPIEFRDDAEIKLLKQFSHSHEWLLGPGDMLYLPPGVPHHGVAVDECLTLSVGMRAPSVAELIGDLADDLVSRLPESQRYVDPPLAPAVDAGEINLEAVRSVRSLLTDALALPESELADWLGRFLTRYRSNALDLSPPKTPRPATIQKALQGGSLLRPHPFARFAWTREGRSARLFSQGRSWRCPLWAARRLCNDEPVDADTYEKLIDGSESMMQELLVSGLFVLDRRPKSSKESTR